VKFTAKEETQNFLINYILQHNFTCNKVFK